MRLVESPSARVEGKKHRLDRMLLLALMGLPLLISLGAYWVFNHGSAGLSVFTLTNLVGPTTESLLKGGGLTACTDELGTPGNPICFHGGRMPLPTLVVALGVKLFGNHFLPVALLKMLLLLIPVELGLYLVWRRLALSNIRKILMTLLLLVPFGITAFIADVVNLQVEEGYSYGFLVLAVAILFFAMDGAAKERLEAARGEWLLCLLFAISVDGVYLAKSSMVVVCLVLVGAFLLKECRLRLRGLVLVLVVAAPLGWALHQHYASGRYSIGTSIDGLNLHKGNNAGFLDRYPAGAGHTLDQFDSELNVGHHFADEWSYNQFHQNAAISYALAHPVETVRADLRKLGVAFVTVKKLGSSESRGVLLKVETAGMLVFRLLLWSAIGCAVYGLIRLRLRKDRLRPTWVANGAIYLGVVAACALPYVLGFAYSRHVSVLIYPTVLLGCSMLADDRAAVALRAAEADELESSFEVPFAAD
jgi:hypothetical protein